MTTETTSTPDINALTSTLKKRIEACGNSAAKRNGKMSVLLPTELKQDLLDTIDLLVSQAQGSGQPSTEDQNSEHQPRETHDALCGLINNTLDSSLAAWQAQIVSSFEQSATRELQQQLATANQLTNDLTRQTQQVEEQRRFFESELAQTLELKARLSRQRKTLAVQFRNQRAELLAAIAERDMQVEAELQRELDAQRQHIASLQAELAQSQQQFFDTEKLLSCAKEQIVDTEQTLTCKKEQLTTAEERLTSTEEQLTSAEQRLTSAEERLTSAEKQLTSAEEQLVRSNEQLAYTEQRLTDAQRQIVEFEQQLASKEEQFTKQMEECGTRQDVQEEIIALREQLQNAEEQRLAIQTTYEELLSARAATATSDACSNQDEIENLEQKLYDQQLELLDLRAQNSDLASQVAKYQMTATSTAPHVSFNQESLSWEERKQLIMQQLDADAAIEDGTTDETNLLKHLEVEDILIATQKEIDRRDREIAELQSIIEQQSSARDGVAIGAAAIAQMLDADDLVNQERQKLKEIQREWEDKLRQAEIDLSMERAKLARERSQLETELEQARKSATSAVVEIEGQTKAQARTRKWLEHLGLKEGRRHEN